MRQLQNLHDKGKSMILTTIESEGEANTRRDDDRLPRRAGEKLRPQEAAKGRFYTSKSFSIGSGS